MNVKQYIESGILESYVLGAASEAETRELLELKKQYAEIQDALYDLETDLERIADHMAVAPPPGLWMKIEDSINELINTPEVETLRDTGHQYKKYDGNNNEYISIEAESNHMRIHKNWKWVLAAVFVLGKIFLGFAIYFYLENRQAQEQIQELKTEIRQQHLKP